MRLAGVELVCPKCRGSLDDVSGGLACARCARTFPVVEGIPDLRLTPDPWIGMQADRDKALRVLQEARGRDFEGTVRAYWSLTPTTSAERAERFVQHVLGAADRTGEWLDVGGAGSVQQGDAPWLDLGCGTADLAEAAPSAVSVVGVDIAMRWLVVAQRRLQEAGREAYLVCANAEALPFGDASFAQVFSLGMVEHCHDIRRVASEARRMLREGGEVRLRSANRFSLLREPHVGLWGVGFLPRGWADAYVRRRIGIGYEHHHPWSARELRLALERAGFRRVRVEAAPVLGAETARSSGAVRRLAPAYEVARGAPVLSRIVAAVAPLLEARGEA